MKISLGRSKVPLQADSEHNLDIRYTIPIGSEYFSRCSSGPSRYSSVKYLYINPNCKVNHYIWLLFFLQNSSNLSGRKTSSDSE